MKAIIWKELIQEYKGVYQVSNFGEVKSLKFEVEKILKPGNNGKGYLTVSLSINGNSKRFRINRLVYEAFNGPIPKGYDCHHRNRIKTDNRLENLELIESRLHSSISQESNSSKYIGVSWDNTKERWIATISLYGERILLGGYSKELDARDAYQDALKMYNQGFTIKQIRNTNKQKREATRKLEMFHRKMLKEIEDRRRRKRKSKN